MSIWQIHRRFWQISGHWQISRHCFWTSGVQDPDFAVQSGRIFGFFNLDWISFSFQLDSDPHNPNEKNLAVQKSWYGIIVV